MWLIMPEFVESERFRIMKYENFMDDLKKLPAFLDSFTLSQYHLLVKLVLYDYKAFFYITLKVAPPSSTRVFSYPKRRSLF